MKSKTDKEKTNNVQKPLYKVEFVQFTNKVYINGNYQSEISKLPKGYQNQSYGKSKVNLAVWENDYIKIIGANNIISIIPINNIATMEVSQLTDEEYNKYF